MAHALCEAGRVRLNGMDAKPASSVTLGDVITVTHGDHRVVAKVLALPTGTAGRTELVEILGRFNLQDLASVLQATIRRRTSDSRH
jgi:ribosomal 50S subunit-recycling heat shock protein